ncbi:MAG: hypothetical protein P0Y59_19685 [Candidatus Sphingomonas phytovorans]|nr:hypothetical protein [Sphingomonas sp.]WEK02683.1 MAG: hypothetical protein P0Y59_19685 [Sphingomonas sp.]
MVINTDRRTYHVELRSAPETIAQSDLPPLFVVGAGGDGELVNYRVRVTRGGKMSSEKSK